MEDVSTTLGDFAMKTAFGLLLCAVCGLFILAPVVRVATAARAELVSALKR